MKVRMFSTMSADTLCHSFNEWSGKNPNFKIFQILDIDQWFADTVSGFLVFYEEVEAFDLGIQYGTVKENLKQEGMFSIQLHPDNVERVRKLCVDSGRAFKISAKYLLEVL